MKKQNKELVDIRYAKGKKYQKIINEIKSLKVCPFCPDNFSWHTKPILKNKGQWFITENFNPYKNTGHHYLIIGKIHKESLNELRRSDWISIAYLVGWITRKFKIKGGGLIIRFGNTLYTGATVKHLHCHLIVPQVKNGKTLPVYFPIG